MAQEAAPAFERCRDLPDRTTRRLAQPQVEREALKLTPASPQPEQAAWADLVIPLGGPVLTREVAPRLKVQVSGLIPINAPFRHPRDGSVQSPHIHQPDTTAKPTQRCRIWR